MTSFKTYLFIALGFLFFTTANANINFDKNPSFDFHQDTDSKKITLKTFNNTYKVELFDTEGNILKTFNLKKNKRKTISTKKLKAGTYFLRYVGNTGKNNSVVKINID